MADAAKASTGKANLIVTAGALTVLAAIGGGVVGKLIVARFRSAPVESVATPPPPLPYPSTLDVRELPAVVTNLASPSESRIRLQVAVVYARSALPEPNPTLAQLSDDIVAFLKTLSLTALQGASGLENLREDLNERVAVRSQGKIRELVIESLVVE